MSRVPIQKNSMQIYGKVGSGMVSPLNANGTASANYAHYGNYNAYSFGNSGTISHSA